MEISHGACLSTVNVLKFRTPFFFLFSNKMLVFRAGIYKILVRIANREDPDQTASSDLGLSRPFWQTANVRSFRTFTVLCFPDSD